MFSIGDCKPSDGAFRSAVSARPVSAVSTARWMSIIVQSVGLERGTDAMHITVPHLRSSVQGAISTIAGRRAAPSRLRKTPPVALKASAVDDFADRRTGSGLLRLRRSSTDVIRGDDVVSIGSTDRGMCAPNGALHVRVGRADERRLRRCSTSRSGPFTSARRRPGRAGRAKCWDRAVLARVRGRVAVSWWGRRTVASPKSATPSAAGAFSNALSSERAVGPRQCRDAERSSRQTARRRGP